MKIKVYEDEKGRWSLHDSPGAREVTAELEAGFHAREDADGALLIEGPSGEPRIRAVDAIRRNILFIPVLKE